MPQPVSDRLGVMPISSRLRNAGSAPLGVGLLLLSVSFSYASLRVAMNHEFDGAKWQDLIDMTAPHPYVGRLLIPRILHVWQSVTGVDRATMFLTVETLTTLALLVGVAVTLRSFLGVRAAVLAAVVLLWGLTVPFMLQHRWAIYYPYDTAALAFTAWGLWAATRGRPIALASLTLVAALNRETALLLPLLGLAIWWPESTFRSALGRAAPGVVAFGAARAIVWLATRHLPGPSTSFVVGGRPRFINNADWMNTGLHPFQVVLFVLALPFAYLLVERSIPLPLRLTRIPLAAMFVGLMGVGNLYEPRIFGEMIVALFIPVAVGAVAWAREETELALEPVAPPAKRSLVRLADKLPWGLVAFCGWWILGSMFLHYPSLAALFRDG